MSFVSYDFLLLGLVVALLYWQLAHRQQNLLLLVASLVFYGWWDWRFLTLFIFSTWINYLCGLFVDRSRRPALSSAGRNSILAVTLGLDLGILALFKYYGFFAHSLVSVLQALGIQASLPVLRVVLPIGISFYTFQGMSYAIDVYRGIVHSTTRFRDVLLFKAFFPQLVAGPIERAGHLLPQLMQPRVLRQEAAWSGLRLALVGYFKKMVLADNLALIVERVFNLQAPHGNEVLLGTYAFAFQIYCDFSGYTDIARGIARFLGIELFENFHLPYFATNPREFWQRWHISLSTWLRDYLYIPLGGNRKGWWRTARNATITMLLGGLWHGASWHFVVWGAYQGLLLVCYQAASSEERLRQETAATWIRRAIFFQLVCLGWLLFRASGMTQVRTMLIALMTASSWRHPIASFEIVGLGLAVVPLALFQCYQHVSNQMEPWNRWSRGWQTAFCVALCGGILLFGAPQPAQFIYYQF